MASKISIIKAIIDAYTSGVTGNYYPAAQSLDMVNAALPKYFINNPKEGDSDGLHVRYSYIINLRASSQENLDTLLNTFLKIDSINSNGYALTTSNYPVWIEIGKYPDDDIPPTLFECKVKLDAIWAVA